MVVRNAPFKAKSEAAAFGSFGNAIFRDGNDQSVAATSKMNTQRWITDLDGV
jgi:hypothetical protein